MTANLNDRLAIELDKPLAPLTTLGVGGNAQYYTIAETSDGLLGALAWAGQRGHSSRILSGGSNLVIADEGVEGLVVDVRLTGVTYEPTPAGTALVTAAAGEDWDGFVAETVARGYSGIECLSGIPGRVGATPIQNVGAYGQEVAHTIRYVDVFDRDSATLIRMAAQDCEFGYRTSRFKHRQVERFVVVAVCFELTSEEPRLSRHSELAQRLAARGSNPLTVRDVRDAVVSLRRSKSMLLDATDPSSRSCGSFFVNPLITQAHAEALQRRFGAEPMPLHPQTGGGFKVAAAWLIEKAGFARGFTDGRVGLSDKHSLAIVARDGATARDVVRLARAIQARVADTFQIRLLPEPVFWGYPHLESGLPLIQS